ncbi:Protein DEHYDRATION-INDUCED 19-like protein 5 [Bienertia sinuspersici]
MHHQHFNSNNKQETAMEMDFWASKVHSSKHLSAHLSSGNRLVLDDSEVKDDARAYFTCPFCYVDIELAMLCDHLQAEHCFDVKNAVCPVCALNLGKDVVGHFVTYHMNSIKVLENFPLLMLLFFFQHELYFLTYSNDPQTRRKAQKSGFWNFYAGRMMGGLNSKGGAGHTNASSPDPLLSPFLFSSPCSETKDDQSHDHSKLSTLNRSKEKEDSEELRQRAAFCQQLFFSTMA